VTGVIKLRLLRIGSTGEDVIELQSACTPTGTCLVRNCCQCIWWFLLYIWFRSKECRDKNRAHELPDCFNSLVDLLFIY